MAFPEAIHFLYIAKELLCCRALHCSAMALPWSATVLLPFALAKLRPSFSSSISLCAMTKNRKNRRERSIAASKKLLCPSVEPANAEHLLCAMQRGDEATTRALVRASQPHIDEIISVTKYEADGGETFERTPLQFAVLQNHSALVCALIEKGVNLNVLVQ